MVRVKEIQRAGNGHRDAGDLRRLAASIQNHGIRVPVKVYPLNTGYGLIDGGDRIAAAEMIGLPEVPAEVVEQPEEKEEAIAHLLTKVRGGGLDALERAREYQKLLDLGCTQVGIAEALGKHPATISQEMGLLRLIPELQEAIARGQLAARAGYHLAGLSRVQQAQIMGAALAAGSTRRVEKMARRLRLLDVVEPAVTRDAWEANSHLRALKKQLPVDEVTRDRLELALMQVERNLKAIWRQM